ncbi:glutathione S-transferase C-terminal domain-containing protein [Phenylobacterium sp.]|uniref:glutathione S-transferase C-terminal domain-containing protein n=1 Tax=Phenylobacterium sp. TaxID=1871053 RepID=UPI0035B4E289
MTYRLYGTPGSLYTGKARSYLVKQRIPFENRAAGEARFRAEIVPRIQRWIIPVLETPDGELVQDGSEIIAWFEARGGVPLPASPPTPLHRLVGQIFELFGGEGLLRPAMHYRWNFDAINGPFLRRDFPAALAPTGAGAAEQAAAFEMASGRMRRAMAGFGVSPDTIPPIEAAYAEFLALFEDHLAGSPYLLGGRPTIGDYGLVAPLYAHLGRDPYPAQLMKATAFRVWRWVERMNAADQDAGEYGAPPAELFPEDGVPETLRRLLRFVAEDYLPEVRAFVGFTNAWLAERPGMAPGTTGLPRPQDRVIGQTSFTWRGLRMQVNVLPYRLYLLQKVQDAFDAAQPHARDAITVLLAETGLSELLTLRTTRRIERRGHLEVWGEAA